MAMPTASAPRVFGREHELAALRAALLMGGGVVVTGAPGAGKSNLLAAFRWEAGERQDTVLAATPTSSEQELPFAGLTALVGRHFDAVASDLPGPQRRALAVALQREEPPEGGIDPLAVPLAFAGLLERLCTQRSVVMMLDDLHWLDQPTVATVAFALRRLGTDRLAVLAGTRPDPGAGGEVLESLPKPRHQIDLLPLDEAAIGQLLRNRLGQTWLPPLSSRVARASAGNPMWALEIARSMQADMSSDQLLARLGAGAVVPVPDALTALIGDRVARLPDAMRQLLLPAAVASRLTVAQLERIRDKAQVQQALETAADVELAAVSADGVIEFTHPLLASALYEAAPPALRRRVHREVAGVLDDPVERAQHRGLSLASPSEGVAAELEGAADIARDRGAIGLVGDLLVRAARATPAHATNAFTRWLRALDAYRDAGAEEAANTALENCAHLAVDAHEQAELLLRRAWGADDVSTSKSLAEQAFRLAPANTQTRVQALIWLASAYREMGRGRIAWRTADWAFQAAEQADLPDLCVEALEERLGVEECWALGQVERTRAEMQHYAARGSKFSQSWVVGAIALNAPWHDATAVDTLRGAVREASDGGRYGAQRWFSSWLVLALIRSSQISEAEVALQDADDAGIWHGFPLPEWAARVAVLAYRGDIGEARRAARKAADAFETEPFLRAAFLAPLSLIEVSSDGWPAAIQCSRELADIFARTGMVDLFGLLWGVDYAYAALQLGLLDEVNAPIRLLREQGERADRPEATAAADRCQALLTAARGESDAAVASLRELVALDGVEPPFEAARSALALGQVARRAGYKGLARDQIQQAVEAFDQMGALRWAERARTEAARVGLHHATGALTETERRVAKLVAEGRTNRETADALFMSVKTVEANLSKIYRKLGVRSRTELATRMTDN